MIDVFLRIILSLGAIVMLITFALAILFVQEPDDLEEEFFDDER